jgi:hypothetical protein
VSSHTPASKKASRNHFVFILPHISITEYITANGRIFYIWIERDPEGDDSGLLDGISGFYRFHIFNYKMNPEV